MNVSFKQMQQLSAAEARARIRDGAYVGHTAGLAAGSLQANLVILPEVYALDFLRFCLRNPKPCPLVGVSDTGNPILSTLGGDIDVRSDLPSYNIYREGLLKAQVNDISKYWRADLVAFALGCSFTFEAALEDAGIQLWHVETDKTVPMFRTDIPLRPSGPFAGQMVVSYRAIPSERITETQQISSRYPAAHGAPVHIGDPAQIGIKDLQAPDWGDSPPVCSDDETPCFWACGVTPQSVVIDQSLPLSITHTPGCMLITDVPDDSEFPIVV